MAAARALLLVHNSRRLRPADPSDEEKFTKLGLGEGEVIEATIKRPRNIRFHRLYWALLTVVWENLENELFPTVDDFHDAIKIMVGLRVRIWLPPGTPLADGSKAGASGAWAYRPGSIAFHKMDNAEFGEFFNRVAELISKWFLPNVTTQVLARQVEQMIGIKPWWDTAAASQWAPKALPAPAAKA